MEKETETTIVCYIRGASKGAVLGFYRGSPVPEDAVCGKHVPKGKDTFVVQANSLYGASGSELFGP